VAVSLNTWFPLALQLAPLYGVQVKVALAASRPADNVMSMLLDVLAAELSSSMK